MALTLYYILILALYVCGARSDRLTAIYTRLIRDGDRASIPAYSASRARFGSAGAFSRSTTAPSSLRQ